MSDVPMPEEMPQRIDPQPSVPMPPPESAEPDPFAAPEPLVVPDEPVSDERPPLSPIPGLTGRKVGSPLRRKQQGERIQFTAEQRLLLLDTWRRSGLPAGDFADLMRISKHTLYAWRKAFEEAGPAGLADQPKGARRGSRMAEATKRAILMMREDHPEWGYQRISDMLARTNGLAASAGAVAHVLQEAGVELTERPEAPEPHRDHVRFFERAKPNQLWQTDIFTFMLKRQNRRVHLVAFLDDHSRFIVGYGLHATASSALVIEVFRAAVASYQAPEEMLTDNGTQYVTWRGKSAFSKELEARGVKHVVASPRHPQTLGKTERFWGTLWRECAGSAIFIDLEDARRRIGHFIDYYNFQRTHSGIDGLVPADRFFGAAPEVLKTLKARVQANAHSLAVNGLPKEPLYLTGKVGDQSFSVHSEGERVILTSPEGRKEIDLVAPTKPPASVPSPQCPTAVPTVEFADEGTAEPPAPGASPIDAIQPPQAGGGQA